MLSPTFLGKSLAVPKPRANGEAKRRSIPLQILIILSLPVYYLFMQCYSQVPLKAEGHMSPQHTSFNLPHPPSIYRK